MLCAVTATGLDGTAEGAAYIPDEEIVPTAELPPGVPFTSQATPVLLVPETVALNCPDWPTCKLALVGEMETDIEGGGVIETVALAEAVVSRALCAVTVTELEGTAAGAV